LKISWNSGAKTCVLHHRGRRRGGEGGAAARRHAAVAPAHSSSVGSRSSGASATHPRAAVEHEAHQARR
jgi:hypothetical protein